MYKARYMAAGVVLALGLAFGAGLYSGISSERAVAATLSTTPPAGVDFAQVWSAWQLLEEHFVKTQSSSTLPTEEERLWGMIEGLTKSYGDPYTVFLPPQEAEQFAEDISGEFSGVGMELGSRDGALTVVAPLKGTPAAAAGVQSGDIVLAIDDTPARTMAVDEAVKLIRGPKGTSVALTFERQGVEEPIRVVIVRDVIVVPLINTTKRQDGVFVIELYSFSETSPGLFRRALREFVESGYNKLVLDLRGNPGGYLEAAVHMASYFLPVGEVVVTEDFAGKRANLVHRSAGYNVFADRNLKMAILVNQGSASASEILAGALAQHGVATLIGERTFGKGSVQQLLDLGEGAELKVTIARWLTPNGLSISNGGLAPALEVKRTPEDVRAGRDPQLDAAVRWLVQ